MLTIEFPYTLRICLFHCSILFFKFFKYFCTASRNIWYIFVLLYTFKCPRLTFACDIANFMVIARNGDIYFQRIRLAILFFTPSSSLQGTNNKCNRETNFLKIVKLPTPAVKFHTIARKANEFASLIFLWTWRKLRICIRARLNKMFVDMQKCQVCKLPLGRIRALVKAKTTAYI